METLLIISQQILVMFLYCAVGFALFRSKLASKEGSKTLASLLLYVLLPSVIIKSFLVERTPEKITELLISFGLGALALAIAMVLAALLFRKNPVSNFSAAFSNAGFMGIPLITAVMNDSAVFYIAGMVAMLNALQFSYGQRIMSKEKTKSNLLGILKNPLLLALLAGLVFFFTGLRLPKLVTQCVSSLAACNGPIAMVVLGMYLGEANLGEIFREPQLYWVSLVRLVLVPAVTALVFTFIPVGDIRLALLIAACAPVGSNVAVYAQKNNQDYVGAVKVVCLSTILSLITMPVIIAAAQLLWK